jgi:hypothetical protein
MSTAFVLLVSGAAVAGVAPSPPSRIPSVKRHPSPRTPEPMHLQIDLVFTGLPLSPEFESAAMEEVIGIWAAYGVDIRVLDGCTDARAAAVRLGVAFTDRADASSAAGALGSIQFVDHVPEPEIKIYPNTIRALIRGVAQTSHNFDDLPFALRSQIEGRVAGRALAHEIGHFLLRSPGHSESGLMRPRHIAPLFVAPERHHFALSREDAERFLSSFAASIP